MLLRALKKPPKGLVIPKKEPISLPASTESDGGYPFGTEKQEADHGKDKPR
jgi:hypothetical protein